MTWVGRSCLVFLFIVTVDAGCAPTRPADFVAQDVASIRNRALRDFALARFYKPDPDEPGAAPDRLAPLLLYERDTVSGAEAAEHPLAALTLDREGRLVADPMRPTMYTQTTTARIRGVEHAQRVYHWWRPIAASESGPAGLHWTWLRVTMDAVGFPVVWEVLAAESNVVLVFVARSVEQAACRAYGQPVAGRDYCVESETAVADGVILVRVLEDGPVPMGPLVYTDSAGVVTSVLCRCMPSQVDRIGWTGGYAVHPSPRLYEIGLSPAQESLFMPQSVIRSTKIAARLADPEWLASVLRWPPP